MFESASLGRKVSKEDFESEIPELRERLLTAQTALPKTKSAVMIVVSGLDGAGKGDTLNRLHEWLDTRLVDTIVMGTPSDEERERPHLWRFWRTLPARGRIGLSFGSWYTAPFLSRVEAKVKESSFDAEMARVAFLEQLLARDGMVIVKFWFHLSKDGQRRRLKALQGSKKDRWKLGKDDWKHHKAYDRIVRTAEHVIRLTDTAEARWFLVDAEDDRHRELAVLRILVEVLETVVKSTAAPKPAPPPTPVAALARSGDALAGPARRRIDTILDHVDLGTKAPAAKEYRSDLARQQARLWKLTWEANRRKVSSVAVFEGWDAAGKGGCIRRMTWAMDARLFHVLSVAKPTDEEYARHYLWRFWRHIPRAGLVTIYDRSWYGRVLVERVEGFAKESEWTRAYLEINDFERQLVTHGTVVTKFWLQISPEAQLERFKERQKIAWKKYKLTDEDWRNREKWRAYELAVHDMVVRTSTNEAPWNLVPACDKRFARLTVLKTFCDRLEGAL